MDVYKPNSRASKEVENTSVPIKKEKVITGAASIKKPNPLKKFVGDFVSAEGNDIKEVFTSSVKNVILDLVTTALGVKPSRRFGGSLANKVSYNSYYKDPAQDNRFARTAPRATMDYDNIIVDNKGDAEAVLDQLTDVIRDYGKAKLSDLYDFCDLSCDYTCHDYGWYDLSTARTVRTRDGRYMFDLPRVEPLK